jgi:hypothetical protein
MTTRHAYVRAVLSAVVAVCIGTSTSAAAATAPTLIAPANGTSFEADSPPLFTVEDNPPSGGKVYIRVSDSPLTNSKGLLGSDAGFLNPTSRSNEPMLFDWQPEGYPFYRWNPGTYYWQASHIDTCSTPPFEPPKLCEPYSPVWEFVVTAIPSPESVSPAEGVAVSAGTTVEFVVHSAVPHDPYIGVELTDGNAPTK